MSNALESRYGKPKQHKKLPTWFWVTLATLAAVCAIAFGLWVQFDRSSANPEYKDTAHEIISADEASLTFEVVKNPEDTAVCAVKALNEERAPVGWVEVTLSPNTPEQGDSSVRTEKVTLRTLETANAVTVDSCWNPEK